VIVFWRGQVSKPVKIQCKKSFMLFRLQSMSVLSARHITSEVLLRVRQEQAAKLATAATRHGIRTHNAIKAIHLDDLFGSAVGGCVPGADIERLENRFDAVEVWDAKKKLGQAVAWEAIDRCIELAEKHGSGTVSVDNAFHYLWGGGYVMEAAKRGYIAVTNCTASLAEVVPFGGSYPTLGTNPHSWGFPTTDAVGFPIVIDWATSVIAMGRVQQFQREGKQLPPHAAVDKGWKFHNGSERGRFTGPIRCTQGIWVGLNERNCCCFYWWLSTNDPEPTTNRG
jgi:LDH2 family malate/lactate/ureidoglycolate dehydrogenase